MARHDMRNGETHRGRRGGFTLIELMVVAAIIAVLLTVTMPAVTGMLSSSQEAQAENLLRASLMGGRYYAIKHGVVAGVRFQSDGSIVQCYAKNTDTTLTVDSYMNQPTYDMVAVDQEAPQKITGRYRVTVRDVGKFSYYFTWPGTWKGNDAWLGKQSDGTYDFEEGWFVFPVVLFAPTGKVILGQCIFRTSPDWYPTMDGAFGKVVDTLYTYQGASAGDLYTITSPTTTTQPMLINFVEMQGAVGNAADIDVALQGMDSTSKDVMLDVNTGMIIRQNDYLKTQGN